MRWRRNDDDELCAFCVCNMLENIMLVVRWQIWRSGVLHRSPSSVVVVAQFASFATLFWTSRFLTWTQNMPVCTSSLQHLQETICAVFTLAYYSSIVIIELMFQRTSIQAPNSKPSPHVSSRNGNTSPNALQNSTFYLTLNRVLYYNQRAMQLHSDEIKL